MKKKFLGVLLVAGMFVFSLTACGTKEETLKEETKEETSNETEKAEATYDNLTVDVDKKEVNFTAKLNGLYLTEPTRHGIVTNGGGNAEKAMFTTDASNIDVNDALAQMGASGDANVAMDDMKAAVSDNIVNTGDTLEYFISWDGQDEIPFNEVLKASADFDWNVVFTGNREVAESSKAGCVLCLDSCAAGVSVNALPVGATGEGGMTFMVDESTGLGDGDEVTITIRVK